MARHSIRDENAAIAIEVRDVAAKKAAYLEAFAECQQGRCTCPTDEYDKLASMEVKDEGDAILIRLETKPGQSLDIAQLETCLDHTEERLR